MQSHSTELDTDHPAEFVTIGETMIMMTPMAAMRLEQAESL